MAILKRFYTILIMRLIIFTRSKDLPRYFVLLPSNQQICWFKIMWHIFVSVAYIVESTPIMIINILLISCMIYERKNFKHNFYFYTFNIILADTLSLLGSGLYTSLCIFFKTNFHDMIERFISIIIDIGWYSKSWFLVFMAFSRFNIFRKKQLMSNHPPSTSTYVICISVWLLYCCVCFLYLWPPYKVYIIDWKNLFTWYYDIKYTYGYIMDIYSIVHNIVVSILLLVFNLSTIFILFKQRKVQIGAINSDPQYQTRKRAEKVLYLQCLLSSAYFILGAIVFICVTLIEVSRVVVVVLHIMWLSQMGEAAFIGLVVNKHLRNACKVVLCIK